MSESQLLELDPADSPSAEFDGVAPYSPAEIPIDTDDLQPIGDPACEKCGAAIGDSRISYCLSCGFYPSLGTYVEIDPWEKVATETEGEEPRPVSHIQVWTRLLPAWGWKLIGCHLAVVVVSIAVRLFSSAGGVFRMAWSVSQLFLGLLVFFACHFLAYMAAIEENADYSLLDFILRPLKVWTPTFRKLPASFRHFAGGTCSYNAALMSIFVIGALPYHVLWDWGIKEPPKQNLVSAIVAHAMEAEGNEDGLEEAVSDFAGTAEGAAVAQKIVEKRRESVDCLIVGYTTSQTGNEIASLILAREFEGKLILIGRVANGLEEETRRTYLEKLKKIARTMPFVQTAVNANWVDPVYTCRVTCKSQTPTGRLIDMQYDRMLGAFD